MPTSSITEFDEPNNETEIIFTAAPEFDEHLNSIPQTLASSATVRIKKARSSLHYLNFLITLRAYYIDLS